MTPSKRTPIAELPAVLRAVIDDPRAVRHVAAAGTVFIAANGPASAAAVVTAGIARLFAVTQDGRRLTVRYARPGAIVGSLDTGSPRQHQRVGVEAMTECEFVTIDPGAIRERLASDPDASMELLKELQIALDETYALGAANALGTIRERVARHLLDSATGQHGGQRVVANVTQAELAESIGSAREVVARALAEFRAEGTIATRRGQIDLLDIARLSVLAGRLLPSAVPFRQDVSPAPGKASRRTVRRRAATQASRQLRVLVIDDDADVFAIVRALLREVIPDVFLVWAPDAASGAAMAIDDQWDALIVDQSLGDGTGVEVIARISAAGVLTPAIMLTGSAERATDLAAMAAGAVDFIPKVNLDATRLERALRYAVARSGTLRAALRPDR